MITLELDACGDVETLPGQIASTITPSPVYLRLVTDHGPGGGWPVYEIASEDPMSLVLVYENVWGGELEDAVEMVRTEVPDFVLPEPTGEVDLTASVHLTVQDGRVTGLVIYPVGDSMRLTAGDPRCVDVAANTCWDVLADLPDSIRWEG